MDVRQIVEMGKDASIIRQVFGEPYERAGVTVVPVARVQGGAGGGEGDDPDGSKGTGGGFGLVARPVGAYVLTDAGVRWEPALDVNRIVAGFQLVAIVGALTVRTIVKVRGRGTA